jgi:enediyne biosynthesis protein E4
MRPLIVAGALLVASSIEIVPATTRVTFTDLTAPSGVSFRHAASKTSVKFLPETMGGGVAVFDADGDGRLDLFFTNGARVTTDTTSARPPDKRDPRFWNRLYCNLGGWKFKDVTEASGVAGTLYDFGAAVADYDNDGDIDLHVTGLGGNTLLRNDGRGRFTDVTTTAEAAVPGWSSSAAFVDYDHDGWLDLFVGRYLAWTWRRPRPGDEIVARVSARQVGRWVPYQIDVREYTRYKEFS